MATAHRSTSRLQRELAALRARVAELERWNHEASRAADALRRSEESFRRIFDHSNDGIFIIDPERDRIVDVNQRACTMLGYSSDELLALPVSSIHPHDLPRMRAFSQHVAEHGHGWIAELTCVTRSGERLAVEISASRLELHDATYVIALVRDIGERKRAEGAVRRAYSQLRSDLEAAARLQRALLPTGSPMFGGIRTAWHVQPCERLGGDLLDVFRLDDRHLGFYLLDVSGHGVRAAMLAVALHHALSPSPQPISLVVERRPEHPGTADIVPPAEVAARLNALFPWTETGQHFITLFYGVLDLDQRQIRYVCAGQNPPVLARRDGTVAVCEGTGYPIGVFPDATFSEHRLELEPGARVFVHSDGVTEAFSPSGEAFGEARLLPAIRAVWSLGLQDGVVGLAARVEHWSRPGGLQDDVSILALQAAEG